MILCTQTDFLAPRVGYHATVDMLAAAGFDALDLSLFDVAQPDGYFSGADALERAQQLREYAAARGLSITQAHAPFGAAATEESIRRAIVIAATAGARQIVVHPLHPIPYRNNEEQLFQENMAYYRSLIPLCEQHGIRVCVENMWQYDKRRDYITDAPCSRPEEFIRYLDTLSSPWIIGCLDLGHCGLVGLEPQEMILALGHDRLRALHVHDNDYRHDSHTLPGCGNINWETVTAVLAAIHYDGEFTFEADCFYQNFEPDFWQEAACFLAKRGRNLIAKIERAAQQG